MHTEGELFPGNAFWLLVPSGWKCTVLKILMVTLSVLGAGRANGLPGDGAEGLRREPGHIGPLATQ